MLQVATVSCELHPNLVDLVAPRLDSLPLPTAVPCVPDLLTLKRKCPMACWSVGASSVPFWPCHCALCLLPPSPHLLDFLFLFLATPHALQDLSSLARINPVPPALEAQNPNHRAAREFPAFCCICCCCCWPEILI